MTPSGEGTGTKLIHEKLTEQIIGSAIDVHKSIGPGLMEAVYEECLCYEFGIRGLKFQRQVPVQLFYKGKNLDCTHRLDVLVEGTVILELKCVEHILRVHEAQLLNIYEAFKQTSWPAHQLHCASAHAGHYSQSLMNSSVSP